MYWLSTLGKITGAIIDAVNIASKQVITGDRRREFFQLHEIYLGVILDVAIKGLEWLGACSSPSHANQPCRTAPGFPTFHGNRRV